MGQQLRRPLTLTLSPVGRGNGFGTRLESVSTFPLPTGERAFRRDLASEATQVAWRKG